LHQFVIAISSSIWGRVDTQTHIERRTDTQTYAMVKQYLLRTTIYWCASNFIVWRVTSVKCRLSFEISKRLRQDVTHILPTLYKNLCYLTARPLCITLSNGAKSISICWTVWGRHGRGSWVWQTDDGRTDGRMDGSDSRL